MRILNFHDCICTEKIFENQFFDQQRASPIYDRNKEFVGIQREKFQLHS